MKKCDSVSSCVGTKKYDLANIDIEHSMNNVWGRVPHEDLTS